MGWATGIAVYIVIWFISLFTVLPIGARRSENPMPGTAESAPDDPRLKLKFSLATGIAFGAGYAVGRIGSAAIGAAAEKPALLDKNGVLRDLSGVIADVTGATLGEEGLKKLAALNAENLPRIEGSPRIGAPIARIDHAKLDALLAETKS